MKTLVILAGGKSSRMGKDKVFLPVRQGGTFLGYLYQRASAVFGRVLISAGTAGHADQIRKLLPEAEVIPDAYHEQGPMGGIVTVFEQTGMEKTAVIPADVPFADMEVLAFLYEQCEGDACIYMPEKGLPEPLIGAYGKEILQKMGDLLKNGTRKIRLAFSDRTVFYAEEDILAEFPEKEKAGLQTAFRNINTTEDYTKYIL